MAVKRESSAPPPPPPPRSPSLSSDEDTSSEEEQDVVQSSPPLTQIPKRTKADDDKSDSDSESESESESESDPEPPKEKLNLPLKPSKSESLSSDEEDEEVEEELEATEKSVVKESESKPDKKKLKISGPDQSPSKKSTSAFLRIWSQEDGMALLRALSEYHATKGRLPPAKDYAALLSTISGSIGFPVTEKQLGNKIRQFKHVYDQKIKKGTDANISKPREKAVFEMCTKLFEGSSKASKKEVKREENGDVKMENGGFVNGGTANGHARGIAADGGLADGDVMARPYFYLGGLIEDLINGKQCPGLLLTVDKVIAQIGESRAKDLEARIKMFRIDAIKLLAREDRLKAELLDILADEMEDD